MRARRALAARGRRSPRRARRDAVSIVSRPPCGIASRALTARLRITCSSCARSASTAGEAGCEPHADVDVVADEPAEHRLHPGDDLVEVEHHRVQHLAAAEREQLPGQRRRLLGRVRRSRSSCSRAGGRRPVEQDLRVARDHGQQVVEVVRDAARQPADRLHLLGLRQALLQPQPVGHVMRQHERGAAPFEADPPGRDLDVDDGAVALAVAPRAGHRRAGAAAEPQAGEDGLDVLHRPDVLDRHAEELLPRVAVVADRRVIDGEELQRLGVVHPHRQRAGLEQHPVALLRALERADEPHGLHRRGGAARQLRGGGEVVDVERVPLAAERDRAPRPVARQQRHAHV